MKRNITIFIILLLSIMIKISLFFFFPNLTIVPDLSLIAIVFFSFYLGPQVGMISGFASGILEDMISLSPLGFNAFIQTVIGFIPGLFKERVMGDSIFFPFLSVAVFSILKQFIATFLASIFDLEFFVGLSKNMTLSILLNSILAPFIFVLLNNIIEKAQKQRKTI